VKKHVFLTKKTPVFRLILSKNRQKITFFPLFRDFRASCKPLFSPQNFHEKTEKTRFFSKKHSKNPLYFTQNFEKTPIFSLFCEKSEKNAKNR